MSVTFREEGGADGTVNVRDYLSHLLNYFSMV